MTIDQYRSTEITFVLHAAIKEAQEDYKRGHKCMVRGFRLVDDSGYIRLHALIWQHQLRRSFSREEIAAAVTALVDSGSLLEDHDEDDTPTGFYRDPTIARAEEAVPSKPRFTISTRVLT